VLCLQLYMCHKSRSLGVIRSTEILIYKTKMRPSFHMHAHKIPWVTQTVSINRSKTLFVREFKQFLSQFEKKCLLLATKPCRLQSAKQAQSPQNWMVQSTPQNDPSSGSALSSPECAIYTPFAFASKTLTASGPLLGAPLGLGILSVPFSLAFGLPFKSRSWLGATPCLPLKRRGVLGLLATNCVFPC
jgi:hypothetical protein